MKWKKNGAGEKEVNPSAATDREIQHIGVLENTDFILHYITELNNMQIFLLDFVNLCKQIIRLSRASISTSCQWANPEARQVVIPTIFSRKNQAVSRNLHAGLSRRFLPAEIKAKAASEKTPEFCRLPHLRRKE